MTYEAQKSGNYYAKKRIVPFCSVVTGLLGYLCVVIVVPALLTPAKF